MLPQQNKIYRDSQRTNEYTDLELETLGMNPSQDSLIEKDQNMNTGQFPSRKMTQAQDLSRGSISIFNCDKATRPSDTNSRVETRMESRFGATDDQRA